MITRTSEPVTNRTPSFEMGEPVSQAERWQGVDLTTVYKIYSIANARLNGLSQNAVDSLIDRTGRDIETNYSDYLQKQLFIELGAAILTYDHPRIERGIGLGFKLNKRNLAA